MELLEVRTVFDIAMVGRLDARVLLVDGDTLVFQMGRPEFIVSRRCRDPGLGIGVVPGVIEIDCTVKNHETRFSGSEVVLVADSVVLDHRFRHSAPSFSVPLFPRTGRILGSCHEDIVVCSATVFGRCVAYVVPSSPSGDSGVAAGQGIHRELSRFQGSNFFCPGLAPVL